MVKKNELFIFQKMILLSILIFGAIFIFDYLLNDNKKIETFSVNRNRNERLRKIKAFSIDPDDEINDDNEFTRLLNEPFQNRLQAIINDAGQEVNEMTFKSNISELEQKSYEIIKGNIVLKDYLNNISFRYRYVPSDNIVLIFPTSKLSLDDIKQEILNTIPSMLDKYSSEVKQLTEEQRQYGTDFITNNLQVYLKISYQFNQPTTTTTSTFQLMNDSEPTTPQTTQPVNRYMPDLEINESFIFSKDSNMIIEKNQLIAYLNYNQADNNSNNSDNNINNINSIALEPIEDINNKVNPKYIDIEIRYKLKNFNPKIDKLLKQWSFN